MGANVGTSNRGGRGKKAGKGDHQDGTCGKEVNWTNLVKGFSGMALGKEKKKRVRPLPSRLWRRKEHLGKKWE